MFFEKARWQYAIEKGLFKDMNKAVMYRLTTPEARLAMYQRIKSGNYKIMPPHTAKIPKDNGDFRTVYVNENVDRILLSIANDLLFELMPEMVHPRCTSYQKGIGCGRVVQDVSRIIYSAEGKIIGWKGDFSKYFDSVPIRFIDWAFDKVEEKYGKSALIDVIRDYYHTDIYFDEDDNLTWKVKKDANGNKKKTFKHTCKGNPYVRLQNKDIFVSDLEKKVFVPLCDLARKMCDSKTYKEVYDAVHEFNKNRKHLAWDTKQSDVFINAYKGSGAYYTMRNLIMFHGARFLKSGRKMSEANSLKELESKAKLYDEQGWRMLGVLKQLIKESGINIQGKIDEWKK